MSVTRPGRQDLLLVTLLVSACTGKHPMPVPGCPAGQHDGGDGKCVSLQRCSDGFLADGTGACARLDPSAGEADLYFQAGLDRQLDMVFMIDNAPSSMAPKVMKMNAQLPKLLAALKDPTDGTLPDLRIALITSDLGTGVGYANLGCDRGWGDLGRFQMRLSPTPCSVESGARFLEYQAGQPVNYTGDINSVFSCLASNLGTGGCGLQHQLQAFEFALAAQGVGNEEQQRAFLRSDAVLGLVFITDEDDCSAAPNDGLFGDFSDVRGESVSLRCATRAHQCGGRNLADAPPGYPTVAPFTHAFADCQARMGDECPHETDTSSPTACNPLVSVTRMADEIKALKTDPDNQILVAGIFGWPLDDAAMANAVYKIAPVANANSADVQHREVFDYWPICYDPDRPPDHPDPSTGFDAAAAASGATGGLREAAYLDQFGPNGLKLSICQRDFSDTMTAIGKGLARRLRGTCVEPTLADLDASSDGVQPDCTVTWRYPEPDPSHAGKSIWRDGATPLPLCSAGATRRERTESCWRLVYDVNGCPKNGQLLEVLPAANDTAGTKIHAHCRVCPDPALGGPTQPGCGG